MKKIIILLVAILLIGCEPELLYRVVITDSAGTVIFDETNRKLNYNISMKGKMSHITIWDYNGYNYKELFSISSEGLTVTKTRLGEIKDDKNN
ncbi:MAG: hypothetical protein FWB73_00295 [Treponema sp.]|nr:hypothetical protein [Treponema sp.]